MAPVRLALLPPALKVALAALPTPTTTLPDLLKLRLPADRLTKLETVAVKPVTLKAVVPAAMALAKV